MTITKRGKRTKNQELRPAKFAPRLVPTAPTVPEGPPLGESLEAASVDQESPLHSLEPVAAPEPVAPLDPDMLLALGAGAEVLEHVAFLAAARTLSAEPSRCAIFAARLAGMLSFAASQAVQGDQEAVAGLEKHVCAAGRAAGITAALPQWSMVALAVESAVVAVGQFAAHLGRTAVTATPAPSSAP